MKSAQASSGPTPRHTVLIADDHVIVREGIAALLKENGFDVVGAVGDGQKLVETARRLAPDVIVTDLSMPGLGGLDALTTLKQGGLNSKVVVLTMHHNADLATRAIRAGASGFLLKEAAGEELVTAVQHALQGRVYLAPAVTRGVMEGLATPRGEPERLLTPRQLDVLRLIVAGKRMKEIAAALQLSTRTVEAHKYEMMETLAVQSTAELVRYAIERGLISD